MVGRRSFGEVERRRSRAGKVTYRSHYMVLSGARYSRTFATMMDAEAWLAAEQQLLDRDEWTAPTARRAEVERREAEAATNTLGAFAESYLQDPDRRLRPSSVRNYRHLLATHILPWFGQVALTEFKLRDIRACRDAMSRKTPAANAPACRLLRSLLQAAEEAELIDRVPPKVRGASNTKVQRVAVSATLDELSVITDHMPERLRLLIVLAALVGLREGELLELRRSDIDGVAARSRSAARLRKTRTGRRQGHARRADG